MAERDAAIAAFLAAHGYGNAERRPLAADASARSYLRLIGGPRPAVLMDAPPDRLDVRPFLRIGEWLRAHGWSAPEVYGAAPEPGLVLLEDLGDGSFTRMVSAGADEAVLYGAAVDLLVDLQRASPPPALPPYDDAKMLSEASLLVEWYAPDLPEAAQAHYRELWQALLPLVRVGRSCTVYVDYHADNLFWLPERRGRERVGLLDFQDARLGPPGYDLVSLLEDARRDVPAALAAAMVERYLARRPELDPAAFRTACAVLGAQRNAKILGLFTRLARRDGKPQYLAHLERVRGHLGRDLAHPALAALRAWSLRHLGPELAA